MNPSVAFLEEPFGGKKSSELLTFFCHTLVNRLQPKREVGEVSSRRTCQDVDKLSIQ